MAREVNYKATTYLRVDGNGNLYSGSKDPKPGYDQYTSKTGNVSYRKVYSGTDFGFMTGLAIEERVYDSGKVRFLVVTIENDKAKDIIQIPLKSQKGELTDLVRKFVALLPGVDFSRELTIASNRKKNDRGYVDRVLFINYVTDGKVEEQGLKFSLKFGEGGDVPMFTTKPGIDGIVYDFTEQDKFLYDRLLEQMERFQKEKPSHSAVATSKSEEAPKVESKPETTQPETKVETKAGPKVDSNEDDDLPF